jgi:hypothetical protein
VIAAGAGADADADAGADAVGIIISTFSNTECDILQQQKEKSTYLYFSYLLIC